MQKIGEAITMARFVFSASGWLQKFCPRNFPLKTGLPLSTPRLVNQFQSRFFFLPISGVLIPRNFGLKTVLPLSTPGLIKKFQSHFFFSQFQA
jgi:hypothetical protein